MQKVIRFLKDRAKALVEFLPAGRDLYLVLAKDRLDIAYRGLFDSYAAARSALSNSRSSHYDIVNQAKANNKEKETQNLETAFYTQDYAPLFWLSKILKEDTVLLELGGSVGKFFYSIQRFHACGSKVRWTVAELPEAVKLGTEIARDRGEHRLTFLESNDLAAAPPADVLFTAGTLQYMEDPIWELLQSLQRLPTHVLIHTLPVHKTTSHWTLQRLPLCEVPYHIYSRIELVDKMASLGYCQIADWSNPRTIEIPFHRDMKIEGYCGFCFRRQSGIDDHRASREAGPAVGELAAASKVSDKQRG